MWNCRLFQSEQSACAEDVRPHNGFPKIDSTARTHYSMRHFIASVGRRVSSDSAELDIVTHGVILSRQVRNERVLARSHVAAMRFIILSSVVCSALY